MQLFFLYINLQVHLHLIKQNPSLASYSFLSPLTISKQEMEKFLSLAEPLLFGHTRLTWITMTIQDFSLRSISFLQPYFKVGTCLTIVQDEEQKKCSATQSKGTEKELSGEDAKRILERLKLSESEQADSISYGAFSRLFEEEEPSLEEVKEAFCVFDENNDGFVDADELQRVLLKLGFVERVAQLENCQKMIKDFDTNQDGRIDFMEFVKLMEISFC